MYYVYILTNKNNEVMYVGITNNLKRRLCEHKNGILNGFSKKYHTNKLVYYEVFSNPLDAIAREKRLKGWKREKKNNLVQSFNPNWDDWSGSFI